MPPPKNARAAAAASAPSNPTRRVLAIVDLLTAHPAESFGLTELCRRLQLNKRTCHAILNTLASAGYLAQDPATRAYRLGPSMIAAGAAAASRIPLVDRAREAMRALGDELGLPSSLLVRGGNAFVFVDRHALPDPLAETIHVGFRLPLQAPLGASLMAWSSRKDFDAWASGLGGIVARRGIEKSIAAIRERGFEVTLRTTAEARLFEELRELRLRVNRPDVGDVSARIVPLFRKETYLLDEIDRDATYSVSCITAPIHGAAPHPGIAIALGGPSLDLRGREIEEIGARLLARIRSFHDDTERDAHA